MNNYHTTYTNQLIQEINATPGEYLPTLLNIVRSFRESITLKPAESSFRQGWEEAMSGEAMPVDELWTGIENDG
ncbi:hypothetical protein [Desulfonema magnum]|uniref:Uncharacterized protein n=1 Tax=Desulfonema magnum TaxID=45655 RepID=A0A975GT49_9BACT|nr:hypothetical protein [Desulfonema magnum]QTA91753.1 Uncharacterized protein dnm_078270 [Desulfonema magnum]